MFIIKIGRALGVFLILATQRPDKDSLPTGVSGNVSTRFCLKVAGQVENDMILGTSALQERRAGHHVPAEDRRRARLPQGRGERPAGRADVLPERPTTPSGSPSAPGRSARPPGTLSGVALGEDDSHAEA